VRSVAPIARGIRRDVEGSRAASVADRIAPLALIVWVAGIVLAEPLAQAGAYASAIVVLLRLTRLTADRDVRRFGAAAFALAAWQAVSPAFALWAGSAPGWPRSGRYGQFFDTTTPALAAAVAPDAPWLALAVVLGVGWALSVLLGVYQHFVRWPFAQPAWFRTPVDRVRESFSISGPPRYGAGGFLFHRLRFAHGAVATLGPTLALAFRARRSIVAAAAMAVAAALLVATYISYARAALVVALLLTVLTMVAVGRGPARFGGLIVIAAAALAILSSSDWRTRFVRGEENLFGGEERRLSLEVGWELARRHPVVGVGFGNYQEAAWATRQHTSVTPLLSIDAHNLWLTAWVETGLVGLILTVAYHALLLQALLRRSRQGSWIAAGALLSFAGFHLLSLVHYLQHHTGVYLSFALVWGLGLAPIASTVASNADGQSWVSTRSMDARKNQSSGCGCST
jgi:O-antigen ligase